MSSSWSLGEEEYSARPYVKAARRSLQIPDLKTASTSSIRDDFSAPWKKYEDYLDKESSTLGNVQQLIDRLLWKYLSVLTAQPFEVAKVLLQAKLGDDPGSLAVPKPAPVQPAAKIVNVETVEPR